MLPASEDRDVKRQGFLALPLRLGRLTYDRAAKAVTYRSDKSEGPTAGTEIADPQTNSSDAMKHFFRWIRFRRAVRLS